MQSVTFKRLASQGSVRSTFLGGALVVLAAFVGGLAASRILYEAFFPHLLFLGRPWPVLLLAGLTSIAGLVLRQRLQRRAAGARLALSSAPLLLNLSYLFYPAVDLSRSRLFFSASLWLALLFWQLSGEPQPVMAPRGRTPLWRHRSLLWIGAAIAVVYLLTMGRSVGQHDTFEFQVVAYQLGIAHPSGYPLYLMLGRLFTLLPFGTVAWRVNLASVAFALLALAFVYLLVRHLSRTEWAAMLATVALAFSPTFWSQALEAEVYTLHALFVAAALWLMVMLSTERRRFGTISGEKWTFSVYICGLFVLLGFSLTNHLTTVFLLPAAVLTWLFLVIRKRLPLADYRLFGAVALSFGLPLTLYAYLPLRWLAVNGEPMGLARFVDWVLGRRFGGALQWSAWLEDPTRYEVIGRLFSHEWPWPFLLLAAAGFAWLVARQWQVALLLAVTWLGYVFYGLNYYVPDLAVFILPAHVITAICLGLALAALAELSRRLPANGVAGLVKTSAEFRHARVLLPSVFLLLASMVLARAAVFWPILDRSGDDGLAQWGRSVLALPLEPGAAILADSEKIAPLYYLQKVEGLRPDLHIMVLPDEAAYRSELDRRLAAGQTVYLARFLPGLEGIYHLRSQGPLLEVSARPLSYLPAGVTPTPLSFGAVHLAGLQIKAESELDPSATAVTFFWQRREAENASGALYVYVRWTDETLTALNGTAAARHPANNYYPTTAWKMGEIVTDFHLLPRPLVAEARHFNLQVALAPPFSRADELMWQTVATVAVPATRPEQIERLRPLRAVIGTQPITGVGFTGQARPQADLPVVLAGYAPDVARLHLALEGAAGQPAARFETPAPVPSSRVPANAYRVPAAWGASVPAELPAGSYRLTAAEPGVASICHWLARPRPTCVLGEVEIRGVSLPESAANFEDKIALLAVDLPETDLVPGGRLPVNLTWQALAPLDEHYTVFVQVVDAHDHIVGQVDAWPLHGTYPTGQWRPGEIIDDPYQVQLSEQLPPGPYRLLVGWYLLGSLRRLPLVDADGVSLDDKVIVTGLNVR
jgi:4-amino-4-deoxy-L-arabinose transferase-like glycosyltransferase